MATRFNIDINVTRRCNLNCSYCFENKENKDFTDIEGLFEFLDIFVESEFFNKHYKICHIGFWGGEPTMRPDIIVKIINKYKNDNRFSFFIYSNGYDIKPELYNVLFELRKEKIDDRPKACIQVSYDGFKLHEKNRLDANGNSTVERIRSTIKKLDYDRVPYTIKSVIRPTQFKYMYDSYKDLRSLVYEDSDHNDFFKTKNYFPTIEYYSDYNFSEDEIQECLKNLRESLIKITASDLKFTKEHNFGFFSWFGKTRAICTAGKDLIALDMDGYFYKCHGAFYDEYRNDHIIGYIKDINIIDKINESRELHKGNFNQDICEGCDTNICLRCNTVKYAHSSKEDYMERFIDYTNQDVLCKFYKEANKYTCGWKR